MSWNTMWCRILIAVGSVGSILFSAVGAEIGPGADAVDLAAETATHEEIEPLQVSFIRLTAICMDTAGNLLAGDGDAKVIKVIGPDGKVSAQYQTGIAPEAIAVAADGTVYCGGSGKVVKLDQTGHPVVSVPFPEDAASPLPKRRRTGGRGNHASGMAVTTAHVFMTVGSGWSQGAKARLFRFDRDLKKPTQLLSGLRGCCQRCDITAWKDTVYVAENGAYRVVPMAADGTTGTKWGARSRTTLEGFGSCCNPMNLCFGKDGDLYTSESGMGRIKRYSADGKFLDLVGYVGTGRFTRASGFAAACSNIAVAVVGNGDRVYVMDYKGSLIRVLARKGASRE